MINIGPYHEEINDKEGILFYPESSTTETYLIVASLIQPGNVGVKIYLVDILNYHDKSKLESGKENTLESFYIDGMPASIDLWGKYFFPTYYGEYQCYYPRSFYPDQKQDYNDDSIMGLAEAMKFGIEYGLKKFNIKPY